MRAELYMSGLQNTTVDRKFTETSVDLPHYPEKLRNSIYDVSMGVIEIGKMGPTITEKEVPQAGGRRLKTIYSGISGGTDLTYFNGTNIYQHFRWDSEKGRFVQLETPQIATPAFGYMVVGEDEQTGELYAARYGAKSGHTLKSEEFAIKLSSDIDPLLGINVAQFGAICANAVAKADITEAKQNGEGFGKGVRGKSVVVMGGGPIGVETAMFMRRAGASEVIVLDMIQERVDFLNKLGIKAMVNKGEETTDFLIDHFKDEKGLGPEITVECTGNPHAAKQTFAFARHSSKVYVMSFYANEKGVQLDENFHRKDLSIVDVQVQTQPEGYSREDLTEETIAMVRDPRDREILKAFVTHKVPMSKAQLAFEALNSGKNAPDLLREYAVHPEDNVVMQVVLYTDEGMAAFLPDSKPVSTETIIIQDTRKAA